MKNIALITIHRNCNYGSVLQTYATQMIFQEMGFHCDVIDYIREVDTKKGLLDRLKGKSEKLKKNPVLLQAAKMAIYPSYLKKEKVFNAFLNRYIQLTPHQYFSNEELVSNPPLADAYCTGSDQIWNSHWNEGVEKAYYLDFVDDRFLRFSYASSIGQDTIDDRESTAIQPMLSKYRFISVREQNSVGLLKKLGMKCVEKVLDPTLYKRPDFWANIASDESGRKPYIVTYNIHHDKKLDEYTQELAKKKNLEIINISYNWHDVIRKGKLSWCPTPEEYLGLIKSAQYVIADSFHATAFSIQFHKQFVVFYPEKASIRMRDLLSATGLESRGVESKPSLELADERIDYQAVDMKMERFRAEDEKYLTMVAEAIKNQMV